MNGVHDMGGMHGMGPLAYEADEPVFHAEWEARAFALTLAMAAWGKWNLDTSRHARERIAPADYLRFSYYEKWIAGLTDLMLRAEMITPAELESGRPNPGSAKAQPPLTADKVPVILATGAPSTRASAAAPRFTPGDAVRARNMHPLGHTRLPRYARGKSGVILRDHGVHVLPDANALARGEQPQHLYSVRFTARELWGDAAAPKDTVTLDLWELYLEPA
jgi:nitrile hydratase